MAKTMSDFDRPEDFEGLIRSLYSVFPNGSKSKKVLDEIIVADNVKDDLVENGYLVEHPVRGEGGEDKKWYTLGPQGILLINSWNIKELTKKTAYLTYLIAFLTFLNLIFLTIQVIT
ncbi:MAG: hypothetical protein BRC29_03140 [Nanohaloarchaea archaeon SW_7_43_1]|nr:MAG: hypothetical protein BRC29_03140 [Nanohaloarchaea archaeon SW_7_43_1]